MILNETAEVSPLNKLLSTLKNNADIKVIYDIGSYMGHFTKDAKEHFPNAKYHLFEPNSVHNDWVKNLGQVHNLYLSDEVKQAEFYSKGINSDSFYPEFTGVHNDIKPEIVTTTTLDGYVKSNGLEYPDLIKLDTQGSELDILNGAQECLEKARFVIIECPVFEYNKNGLTFNHYLGYMLEHKFLPIYLTEVHYLNGIICQLDFAFIKQSV